MSPSKPLFPAAVVVCGLLAFSTGCQSLGMKKDMGNPLSKLRKDEVRTGTPDRVVATWSEAVLHRSGKGTRGFGGRLYFYDRKSAEPMKVEGQLVVYAFEEDDPSIPKDQYSKRYVFPPEQFTKHVSDSEIGVSYSVWLPWDEVGGDQAEVSLIARFEPLQGGGLVVSDQARQRLPGKAKLPAMVAEQPAETPPTRNMVEQAGFNTSVEVRDVGTQEVAKEEKPQLKATTISLPGKFRHLPRNQTAEPAAINGADASPASMPSNVSNYKPTPISTSVDYLTPGESVRKSTQRRSSDSSR